MKVATSITKKGSCLYKVQDLDGKWITLSFKSYGAVVKKSFTGGKVYSSLSSFQARLKSFVEFSRQNRGIVKYADDVMSTSQFIETTIKWKVVPFSRGREIDMTFLMDSYKNEAI